MCGWTPAALPPFTHVVCITIPYRVGKSRYGGHRHGLLVKIGSRSRGAASHEVTVEQLSSG